MSDQQPPPVRDVQRWENEGGDLRVREVDTDRWQRTSQQVVQILAKLLRRFGKRSDPSADDQHAKR